MHPSSVENPIALSEDMTLLETIELDIVDPNGHVIAAQDVPLHVHSDGSRFVRVTINVRGAEGKNDHGMMS